MALTRIRCPHCSEELPLENRPAGEIITCAACGRQVAIPAVPPTDDDALDFLADSASLGTSQRRKRAAHASARPLSRVEKRRRQQRRSVFVMILGLLVLAAAVVVISRIQQP